MKRNILNMLAVFVLLLACTVGFVACGKKAETPAQLKPEDFVGEWYVENVVYSEEGHDTETYTIEQFQDLHDRDVAGQTTPEETHLFEDTLWYMFFRFYVKENGYIHHMSYYESTPWSSVLANESDEQACGTWEIVNNQLNAEMVASTFYATSVESVYSNGKIVVTATGADFTTVLTLAKTVAA